MSIWKKRALLEDMQKFQKNTMLEHIGVEFVEIGDDYIRAKMPVDNRTRQPFGLLHGGASCVLAESLGSVGGHLSIDENQIAVGQSINTNHIRMAKSGFVYGTARPIHLGSRSHIWEIDIRNEEDKLVSITRLTLAILDK